MLLKTFTVSFEFAVFFNTFTEKIILPFYQFFYVGYITRRL